MKRRCFEINYAGRSGCFVPPTIRKVLGWYQKRWEEGGEGCEWFSEVEYRLVPRLVGGGYYVSRLEVRYRWLGEEGDEDEEVMVKAYLVDPDDDGNEPITGLRGKGAALVMGRLILCSD